VTARFQLSNWIPSVKMGFRGKSRVWVDFPCLGVERSECRVTQGRRLGREEDSSED
jgi:hypothetical protein